VNVGGGDREVRPRSPALERVEMEPDIGDGAGLIWQYLHEHGETTLGRLRHGTKLSDQLLLMGVGWLAREGKVSIVQQGRTVKLSLRES
jgi:hypothetical protein